MEGGEQENLKMSYTECYCCTRVRDGPGDDARVTAGVDARAGIFDHFARRSRSTKIKGLFSFILSVLGAISRVGGDWG